LKSSRFSSVVIEVEKLKALLADINPAEGISLSCCLDRFESNARSVSGQQGDHQSNREK